MTDPTREEPAVSYLAFHAEHQDVVHVAGWEHAWLHWLPVQVALGVVPTDSRELEPRLTSFSPLRRWLDQPSLPTWIRTYSRGSASQAVYLDHDGTPLDTWHLALNTALVMGSDPIALATRLAAQSEIHCYVEGPNRAWLAGLIETGRASGVLRAGAGWEATVEMLRARDDEPVVCSYSVSDSFPNASIAGWAPEPDDGGDIDDEAWDGWYDLAHDEQWRLSLARLRASSGGLELSPDALRAPFGARRSFVDLFVSSPADRRALTP